MRKIVIGLFFLLGMSSLILAQEKSTQAVFDEANTLFSDGELSEAMKLYRGIEKSRDVSGALYLNMGIAAVQLDSMGLAKFYFLKASYFEETSDEALQALEYVESRFSRQSATLPKLPWDRAVQWMDEVPGPSGVFLLGTLILITGFVFLYLKWFKLLNFKNLNWYIIGIFITGSAIIFLSFYVDYIDLRYNEAVIVIDETKVMQNPHDDSNLVSLAYEGYDLIIDEWESDEHPEWLYVRLGNGQFGWIKNNGVRIL